LVGYFKYDLTDPDAPRIKRVMFPRDVNGGECCFVAKPGGRDEDDGYLIGIVSHLPRDLNRPKMYADSYRSYVWIFDAKLRDLEALEEFRVSNALESTIKSDDTSCESQWVGRVPGLIASILLPSRIPWGLHNLFLPNDELFPY